MLLTLYYLAATWIQSWRLNSIRAKILNVLSHNGSLVLYKELEPTPSESEGGFNIQLTGVSSSSCSNSSEARVGDLLWYVGNKRGCSVFPQQKVNAMHWISFHNEKSLFPLEISGSSQVTLLDDKKLHLLIEANYLQADGIRSQSYCELEQYGIPRAWKAGDQFAVILETDVDHLVKLGSGFMSNTLSIDDGMEIVRVQSVAVEGRPCLLLNTDSIPITRTPTKQEDASVSLDSEASPSHGLGQQMSPMQWQTHVELLQSFSDAATQASESNQQIGVPGYPSTLITAGSRALSLDCPTVLNLSDSADCFPVVNLSRLAREEIQCRSNLNLASQADDGGESSGEAAGTSRESRSHKPGLPEEQKSSESFSSCVQDMDLPSPDPEIAVSHASEKKDVLPGTSKEEVPPLPSPRESKSSDSFCSLGSASTVSIGDKAKAAEALSANGQQRSTGKLLSPYAHGPPPGLLDSGPRAKPPNVLVFSESSATVEDVKTVLYSTLHRHKYTIYPVSKEQLQASPWMDNTLLLVVSGAVPEPLAPLFLGYVLAGGRMLCLCSDLLHLVLPAFRTAEVRERELVRFSYGRWRGVRLMHHVFCYQASPARTRFSRQDATSADDAPLNNGERLSPPKPPSCVEVVDAENKPHTLHVQVLGTEETWHTPSLLLASAGSTGGRIVFSQVHLEVDPGEYASDESVAGTLRGSEQARHEILQDLLSQHLGLECGPVQPEPAFTPAYFLGRHELKLELLSQLQSRFGTGADNTVQLPQIALHFCGKGVEPSRATASHLPVLVHSCPANFSTVEYYENLHSELLGRLVLYCEMMTSSMDILTGVVLHHGLAVVPCQQTKGAGRGGNAWLSPEGCAMFSLQLHISVDSYLGRHTPFLQHIVGLAVVSSVCSVTGYEVLNLRLKWPNDIYFGNSMKLGGLVVNSTIDKSQAVCNIGVGVNLDNKFPTTCINSLIEEHNKAAPTAKLTRLSHERFLARVFTELERLLNLVQAGEVEQVRTLYYGYWLHSNAEVTVVGPDGSSQSAVVIGVDDFGFLQVQGQSGLVFSVHPDGNSFDMLRGLVSPKVL